jgi:fatty acid desaturase
MITARAYQTAVTEFESVRPWPGLIKTALMAALTLPAGYFALTAASTAAFVVWSLAAGCLYASWLITTHDALHHTLTGWRWFDELVPRLVAHPIIWMHGTYGEIHKLHHKMNGSDFDDPERVQWTVAEYEAASPLGRFYARDQWLFVILVFGGIGLIYDTVKQARKFAPRSQALRRQLQLDIALIAAWNVAIYSYAAAHGSALRYLAFWFILERIGGGVLQWRAHIEHYGLWGKGRHYFETQTLVCRNLRTSGFASWFFNRLNYHSVHHAFPRVPFYNLAAAHRKLAALGPLVEDESYLATAWRLASHPTLIGAVDAASPTGRHVMVPI